MTSTKTSSNPAACRRAGKVSGSTTTIVSNKWSRRNERACATTPVASSQLDASRHRPPACSRRAGGKRAFERPPRDRPKELTQILRSAGEHVPRRWVLGEPKPTDGPFSGGRITGESPPARLLHAGGRVGSVARSHREHTPPVAVKRARLARSTLQNRNQGRSFRNLSGRQFAVRGHQIQRAGTRPGRRSRGGHSESG